MKWPHAAPRIKPSVAGELPAARIEVNLTGGRGRLPQPSVVLAEPDGVTTRRISPLSLSEFAGAKSIFTAAVAFPLLSRRGRRPVVLLPWVTRRRGAWGQRRIPLLFSLSLFLKN